MQAVQILSLTLLCALAASAQTLNPGKCPQPPVQQNFDTARYLGKWYEIQKFPAIFQKGECGQATYTPRTEGGVNVLNEELLSDGTVNSIEGFAKAKDDSEPAKLLVSFFAGGPPGNYWVLSTDYDNYALVYGCSNYLGLFHVEFSWVLARSRTLPEETIAQIEGILSSNGINPGNMIKTDQSEDLCSGMPQ